MKRIKNKYHQISEMENLYLAFYKAQRGKRLKPNVIEFIEDLDKNLSKMSQQIKQNAFPVGDYTYFTINDPKKRTICAASFSERVYHHAIMNVCHKAFDDYQIYHSYATRPNKGVHKALQYVYDYQIQGGWYVKMDVKKFFDTINHQALKNYLEKRFKEQNLLQSFYDIIDSYEVEKGKGLPIGNLTSQYFANFYLAHLDRYAKEVLHIKRYIRYMDDIVFWTNTHKQAQDISKKLDAFLQDKLQQVFKPKIMNISPYPFSFLGFVVNKEGLRPKKRNRTKYKNKLNELKKEVTNRTISEWKANQNYWSLHSFYKYNLKIQTTKSV